MNKSKTLIVVLLVMLLSTFSIFANGSGEKESGKTVIKVAHIYDPMGGSGDKIGSEWFKSVKAEFESENPNIEVEFENFAWDQIDIKLMQDYRSGISDHDVAMLTPQLFAQHREVGDLTDLASYIKKDWSSNEIDEFSWASTYTQGNVKGQQIAIPLGSHSRIMLFNKDMFKAAGLDPNDPPKTIDELIEYAKKLTVDTNGDGTIDQYGLAMALGPDRGTIELTFGPLIWNFGGELWDSVNDKADIDSPEAIKTAELIWDLLNKYKVVNPASPVNDMTVNLFNTTMNEKAAIILGWGSYWVGSLEEQGYVKGVIPPSVDAELVKVGFAQYPTTAQAGFTNSWGVGIYQNSTNKDAAWKFLNYMLKKDNLRKFPDAGLPIRKSEWQTPEYQTEYYQTYFDAIKLGKPMPVTPYYGELADVVSAALQTCMNGDREDIPQILKTAEKEFNSKYEN